MKYKDFLKEANNDILQIVRDPLYQKQPYKLGFVLIDPMNQIQSLLTTGQPTLPNRLKHLESRVDDKNPILDSIFINDGYYYYITPNNPTNFIYPTNILNRDREETSFQSIDPILGHSFFTFYHELGHALESSLKTSNEEHQSTHYQKFLSECASDLFSIITLAKKGKEIDQMKNDVMVFRLSTIKKNASENEEKENSLMYYTHLSFPLITSLFAKTKSLGHFETFQIIFSTLQKEMDSYKIFFEKDQNTEHVKNFRRNQENIAKKFMQSIKKVTYEDELDLRENFQKLHPEYDVMAAKMAEKLYILLNLRKKIIPDEIVSPYIVLSYIEQEIIKKRDKDLFPKDLQSHSWKTKEDIQKWYQKLKDFTEDHPTYSFLTPHIEKILNINNNATKIPKNKTFYTHGNSNSPYTILHYKKSRTYLPLSFLANNKTKAIALLRPPLKKTKTFSLPKDKNPVEGKRTEYSKTDYTTIRAFLKKYYPEIQVYKLQEPLSPEKIQKIEQSYKNGKTNYIGPEKDFLKYLQESIPAQNFSDKKSSLSQNLSKS